MFFFEGARGGKIHLSISRKNSGMKLKLSITTLAKVNYQIDTDAIKENLIPNKITNHQSGIGYTSKADLLNVALFGMIAKEWRNKVATTQIALFARK